MSKSHNADVIIVGGGIAGLAAAKHLVSQNRRVLLLEARDRLGGRVDTFEIDGHKVDLGASFAHGIYGNPLIEVMANIGMPLLIPPERNGYGIDHTGKRLPIDLANQIGQNVMGAFFVEARHISASGEIPAADATLSHVIIDDPHSILYEGLETPTARFYAQSFARGLQGWTGAPLNRVSLRWWGFERDSHGPDAWVTSGYSTLVGWLRSQIDENADARINLGEEVLNIALEDPASDDDAGFVTVHTQRKGADGNIKATYSAPLVLVTVPLGVLKRNSLFTPPLPPRHLASIDRLGFGLLNKIVLFYPSAWWPKNTPNFYFLPNPDEPSSARFAVPDSTILAQNMWLQNQTPALLIFLGGEVGEKAEGESDTDLKKWAEDVVWKYLSPTITDSTMSHPTPTHVEITRWRSDPFAQGSYCYIPPATSPNSSATPPSPLDILQLSRPVGERLFFAGEHTEADHYASVHAAWISGLREGRALETHLKARDGTLPSNVVVPDRQAKY